MKLATCDLIKQIDNFSEQSGIASKQVLMQKAGQAVANAVRSAIPQGSRVLIIAGKGNNGGDGYSAAIELCPDFSVSVFAPFGAEQKNAEGRHFLSLAREASIKIYSLESYDIAKSYIASADCIVDALFGVGFSGDIPEALLPIVKSINSSSAKIIAVDLPLGILSDSGEVLPNAIRAHQTVALSYLKPAHVSYPAKEYMGKVTLDTLGLDGVTYPDDIKFSYFLIDRAFVKENLPQRKETANKGSFGKALLIVGSDKYRGAAHLSMEAALRSGVGYVGFFGDVELSRELRMKFPEAIYEKKSKSLSEISSKYSAVLIGSGSGVSGELADIISELLDSEGAPIIIDADGINAIAKFNLQAKLKASPREIVLTPHPLEFSRISGIPVEDINAKRIEAAEGFAREYGVTVLLKGAATVVTNGISTYINSSGSQALAKAGSGDVLSGIIVAMIASGLSSDIACALSAYIHGAAGDSLAEEYSSLGVTPSDLPKYIARILAGIEKEIL